MENNYITFSTLVEGYRTKCEKRDAEMEKVNARRAKFLDEAVRLENRAQTKKDMAQYIWDTFIRENPAVSWFDDVIRPLAESLAYALGKNYKVFGPSGLACKCTILLFEGKPDFIWKVDHYALVVEPDFRHDKYWFNYETGEEKYDFKEGTLGYVSGLNRCTAPLPNTLEEILALVRFVEGTD